MKKQRPLYWSRFNLYENCPQKYLWKYGWGQIDVGGGPGKPKPKPEQKSEHNALTGRVLSYVVEKLYNDELYKDPSTLLKKLDEIALKKLDDEVRRSYIDWKKSPPYGKLQQECTDNIRNFLKTMKGQKLLGEYAKSEVNLVAWIQKDKYPIGGKVDLLLRKGGEGISILDGKMSKWKEKYSDPDQLRWYALCFYLLYQVMPDHIGWIWFRYPYGSTDEDGEIQEGMTYIDFDKQDLMDLSTRAVEVYHNREKEYFDANPVPSYCKFCDWESVCPQRQEQRRKNAEKRSPSKKKNVDFYGTETFTL